jgi:tetratricopeptide (TPR) repeat protein
VLAGWEVVREARAERDRVVEQSKREGAVRAALERVRQEQDAGQWSRAREQAQRALTLVESGPADTVLAAQVRQVQEQLDEEEKDRTLLLALEKARLSRGTTIVGENRFATEGAVPLFREALRVYGLPPGEGDPATAAARIAQRPAPVREALLGALDEWLTVAANRRVAEPHSDWLRAVLLAVEPTDPWGQRLRAATLEKDLVKRRAALEKLAAEADGEKLAARSREMLYWWLCSVEAQATALRLLRRARVEYPGDFWVNHQLGVALQEGATPDLEEAVRFLTVAAALRPDSPGCYQNLGKALTRKGRLDEAVACFRKAIALDANYVTAHLHLVDAQITLGQLDEAVASGRQAIAHAPKAAWAHYCLGIALNDKGQLEEAVCSFRQAIALDPRYVLAHIHLGLALQAQGRLDEAITSYQRAIDLDPRHTGAHVNLASVLLRKGLLDEAITCYRRTLDLDPKMVLAHCNLGRALQRQGREDEALTCFRRALDLDPRNAEVHADVGSALRAKGQLDEAIVCLLRALELDPKMAGAHANLGNALEGKGQVDEAIACYQRAIDLDPRRAMAHHNLGNALCRKGQADEAIACYRRALDLDPNHAETHVNLGRELQGKGRVDEAITCFRRALDLNPKLSQAHGGLAHVLMSQGRVDEAVACFRRALELDPRYTWAHYNLGVLLQAKGRVDEAIACYRRVLELDPHYAEAHCNLGGCLGMRGDFRAALAAMRTGHELGSRQPDWRHPSGDWVKLFVRCVRLDDLLTATRERKARPAGPAECLELADFCSRDKHCLAAAVRFYTEAFTAEPKLAADLQAACRYRAALSAALAGCGQGQDAAGLDAAERARLRWQGLEWLRADLEAWTREHKTASPQTGQAVAARMQQWLGEPGLAGVREAAGLAELPAEERSLWQAFWADIAALRTRADEARKQPESNPTPQPEQ